MARERKILTNPDGSLYYRLVRNRTIEVPGTKGLKITEQQDVPQLPTNIDLDTMLETALNMVQANTDAERVEKLVGIINAGLVADAGVAMQTALNRRINSNQIVSDFASIVSLTKSMFGDMSDGDRAALILEKFPEIANKLEAAGLKLVGDDEESDVDDEEIDD